MKFNIINNIIKFILFSFCVISFFMMSGPRKDDGFIDY